ncbi:Bax inhibitor-1 family protein [Zea mays]|uniref:Bax inhibitor-1 family protein n=1 Tax=Zea mays TaxID=4577 RepID=A0A1D6L7L1_MAIZE|nr:Bax inhibitor-1 family protein [Zea mays]
MGKHGHGKCHDVEACYPPGAAGGGKYPYMTENPQLRWAFIRKVYVIVCLQLLLTVAVAATVNLVRAIGDFFLSRTMGAMFAIIGVIVAPILAAPGEPRAPGALHRLHQLRRGAELPDGERASDTGGGGDHDGGGAGAHLLHLLGGEEGLRVRVPGAVPGVRLPHPHALLPPADHLPAGQDGDHGVRLHRRARLLRLHHLRHRQPHQGLLLRRVRRRRHRALPRHHQPLPGHPSGARRRRLIGSYI